MVLAAVEIASKRSGCAGNVYNLYAAKLSLLEVQKNVNNFNNVSFIRSSSLVEISCNI